MKIKWDDYENNCLKPQFIQRRQEKTEIGTNNIWNK